MKAWYDVTSGRMSKKQNVTNKTTPMIQRTSFMTARTAGVFGVKVILPRISGFICLQSIPNLSLFVVSSVRKKLLQNWPVKLTKNKKYKTYAIEI